ncbi:MAG: O-antigen ligase family protein [Thermoanaerobaculia bacterium]
MSRSTAARASAGERSPSRPEILLWTSLLVALLFHNPYGELGPESDRFLLIQLLALAGVALTLVRGADGLHGLAGPDGPPDPARSLARVVVLWGCAATVSAVFSIDPVRSLFGAPPRLAGLASELALVALFFLWIPVLRSGAARERAENVLLLGAAAMVVYAGAQWAGLDPVLWTEDWQGRPTGAQGNPLFLAQALVWLAPLVAQRAFRAWRSERKGEAALFAVLLTGLLLVALRTGARAALVGLAVAGLLLLLLLAAPGWRPLATRRGVLAVALLALASGTAVTVGGVMALRQQPGTAAQRALVWSSVADLVRQSPPGRWIAGQGQESLAIVLPPRLPAELAEQTWAPDRYQDRAHNALLDALVAGGILRVVLGLGLVAFALWLAADRCAAPAGSSTHERYRAAGLLAALVGNAIALGTGVATVATDVLFWFALAVLAAIRGGGGVDDAAGSRANAAPAPASSGRAAAFGLILQISIFTFWIPAQAVGAGGWRRPLLLAMVAVGTGAFVVVAGERRLLTRGLLVAAVYLIVHLVLLGKVRFGWVVVAFLVALFVAVLRGAGSTRPRPPGAGGLHTVARLAGGGALLLAAVAAVAAIGSGVALEEGRTLLVTGSPDAAVEPLERAVRWAPQFEDGSVALVHALLRQADREARQGHDPSPLLERAQRELANGRALHPRLPLFAVETAHTAARSAEATAEPGARAERFRSSVDLYREALVVDPWSAAARRGLGAVLLETGDLASARAEVGEAVRLAPRSIETQLLLGRVALTQGDFATARSAYEAARAVDAGRARSLLETLARARPDDASAFRDLGFLDLVEGRNAQARLAFEHATRIASPGELTLLVRLLTAASASR